MSNKKNLAFEARKLVRSTPVATLATSFISKDSELNSWPYASLVLIATDFYGAPLLFISSLAEHTKNISHNSKVGLLLDGTEGSTNRLAEKRITLLGKAIKVDSLVAWNRYLSRHQEAEIYASFSDFSLYKIDVKYAQIVAGFGKIQWLDHKDLILNHTQLDDLANSESDIIAEINEINSNNIQDIGSKILPNSQGNWLIIGFDPEGCELKFGSTIHRVSFNNVVLSTLDLRKELAAVGLSNYNNYN